MRVLTKYGNGRLDVFDTDSHTATMPFGDGNALTDYEVRFDELEKGLWLQAHFYEIDARFREGLDDEAVPVGRRAMGWRFLLAEPEEVEGIVEVLVDGDRALVRMGDDLVDAMRLDYASALLLSDGGGPPLASKLQGVVDALRKADETLDDDAAAKLAGGSWESLAWARELQPLREIEVADEEEGWMDYEGD